MEEQFWSKESCTKLGFSKDQEQKKQFLRPKTSFFHHQFLPCDNLNEGLPYKWMSIEFHFDEDRDGTEVLKFQRNLKISENFGQKLENTGKLPTILKNSTKIIKEILRKLQKRFFKNVEKM